MREKILLTKEKKAALELELKNLIEKKKPEISAALALARQNDLSEDTDDLSVMLEEKETIDDRIAEVKDILANIKVIDKESCTPFSVSIGSEIKVEIKGKKLNMKIVSSIESDPSKGYISDHSPLGKALLKSKKGEIAKVKVGGNTLEYKVLEIC